MNSFFFKIFLPIFIFSLLSFKNVFYNVFLVKNLPSGWAYVVDFGGILFLPLSISLIYFLKKYGFSKIIKKVKSWIINNKIQAIILLLCLVIVRHYVLDYYFFAEDVYSILWPLNNGSINPSWYIVNGYPFLPFIFSFLVFNTNALFYNLLSISLLYFASLVIYEAIKLLIKNRTISLLSAIFFLITPSYLDAFSWQATIQGSLLAFNISMLSIIFFILYRKESNKVFLMMSLLLFASSFKIGFVRSAGMIFVIEYIILVFFKKNVKPFTKIIEGSMYFLIWLGYGFISSIAPFSSGRVPMDYKLIFDNLIFPLFYYTSKLFIPFQVAKNIIPLRELFFPFVPSAIWLYGGILFIVLMITGLIGIVKIKKIYGKILVLGVSFFIFNIFYIPIFQTVPHVEIFDRHFVMQSPPYGPGSRYVLFSAVGIGIILSTLFYYLITRKNVFFKAISVFLVAYLALNAFYTIQSHRAITNSIGKPDRFFFNSFFKLVPRNGQPKLVFSSNPQKNAIDVNVGGATWLNGFYKQNELIYTKNEENFIAFSPRFDRKNIFAFYSNSETNSFKDISKDIYSELLDKNRKKEKYPLKFSSKPSNIIKPKTDAMGRNKLNRSILISDDLNYRILSKKNFPLDMSFKEAIANNFPYSDFVISEDKFPDILWSIISNNYPSFFVKINQVPDEFILDSFDSNSIKNIDLSKKEEIIEILKRREDLGKNMQISVSDKKDDARVDETALIDGLYSSEPYPTGSQKFYRSEKNHVTIDLSFSYPIVLGRVILNTPLGYSSRYYPNNVEVMSSFDGLNYQSVSFEEDRASSAWSPNNGKMIQVNLKPLVSKYLKLILTNNDVIILDEIVVDEQNSLKYTPQQIIDYRIKAFLSVDDLDSLNNLKSVDYYSKLSLVYACAEDDDWETQKRNFSKLLSGVWHNEEFDLRNKKIALSINCNGSVLRKIVIFGPPYPGELKINNAFLE